MCYVVIVVCGMILRWGRKRGGVAETEGDGEKRMGLPSRRRWGVRFGWFCFCVFFCGGFWKRCSLMIGMDREDEDILHS